MKYFEARRFLAGAHVVRSKPPAFAFSAETRADLQRILGPRPELIARLQHEVAPGGFVAGPIFTRYYGRRAAMEREWRKLARVIGALRASLQSLRYEAGIDLESGGDGRWEAEHNCDGTGIDLAEFDAHAERIAGILDWLLSKSSPRKRGRPSGISMDRFFLGMGGARALQDAGVKLTKGRDGILAKTLSILFEVASLGPPEDMLDSVRAAVRWAEAKTPEAR